MRIKNASPANQKPVMRFCLFRTRTDTVARFKRTAGRKIVAPFPFGKFAGKAFCVAAAIPGFDADKGGMLARGRPDAKKRRIKCNRKIRLFVWQTEGDFVALVVFNDKCVVVKQVRVQGQIAICEVETCSFGCCKTAFAELRDTECIGIKMQEILVLVVCCV